MMKGAVEPPNWLMVIILTGISGQDFRILFLEVFLTGFRLRVWGGGGLGYKTPAFESWGERAMNLHHEELGPC